jgi:hypothetical protein
MVGDLQPETGFSSGPVQTTPSGTKKIRLVHSFQDKEAEWVLMEAVY